MGHTTLTDDLAAEMKISHHLYSMQKMRNLRFEKEVFAGFEKFMQLTKIGADYIRNSSIWPSHVLNCLPLVTGADSILKMSLRTHIRHQISEMRHLFT